MALVPYRSRNAAVYTGPPFGTQKYGMSMMTPRNSYNALGTPYTARARTRTPYSRTKSGPYGALTNNNKHVNTIYPPSEIKFQDFSQAAVFTGANSPASITAAANVFCINTIAQSTGAQGRIGQSINMKSVAYRYEIDLPTTTPVPTSGRVMLVWDKQSNAAATAPAYADIFAATSYLAFMSVGNTDRYVILRNQQFSVNPQGDQNLFFEGYCKINMKTTWPIAATGATIPQTGALYLVYISDQTVAASQPLINGCWRIRYTDS